MSGELDPLEAEFHRAQHGPRTDLVQQVKVPRTMIVRPTGRIDGPHFMEVAFMPRGAVTLWIDPKPWQDAGYPDNFVVQVVLVDPSEYP